MVIGSRAESNETNEANEASRRDEISYRNWLAPRERDDSALKTIAFHIIGKIMLFLIAHDNNSFLKRER